MSYLDMITFDGPTGTVAIDPKYASIVWKRGDHCEVQLLTTERIQLHIDAESVAIALWGFPTDVGDMFINDAHVMAIVPQGNGNCMMLRSPMHLSTDRPVNEMIMSLRQTEVRREELRRGGD